MSTKAFTVVLGMILFLYWRMTLRAVISRRTLLPFFYVGAHGAGVKDSRAPSVFLVVIIDAHFVIMFDCNIAGTDFKNIKVELLNIKGVTLMTEEGVNL
jgi:hypothetical protein